MAVADKALVPLSALIALGWLGNTILKSRGVPWASNINDYFEPALAAAGAIIALRQQNKEGKLAEEAGIIDARSVAPNESATMPIHIVFGLQWVLAVFAMTNYSTLAGLVTTFFPPLVVKLSRLTAEHLPESVIGARIVGCIVGGIAGATLSSILFEPSVVSAGAALGAYFVSAIAGHLAKPAIKHIGLLPALLSTICLLGGLGVLSNASFFFQNPQRGVAFLYASFAVFFGILTIRFLPQIEEMKERAATTHRVQSVQASQETIRVVPDNKYSHWSHGATGDNKPILFVTFHASITDISGKNIKIVSAELPGNADHAERIDICNGFDGQRPQVLQPHETADLSIMFVIPSIRLQDSESWKSPVVVIDQYGNRHEVNAAFKSHPINPTTVK